MAAAQAAVGATGQGFIHNMAAAFLRMLSGLIAPSSDGSPGGAGGGAGPSGAGIIPGAGEIVGASMFGGPTDPSTPTDSGAFGHLNGTMGFAELSNNPAAGIYADFAALGHLAPHTRLRITYGKKTVTGEKLDVGAGGGAVEGHKRAIDLWWQTAGALGFPGTGLVQIAPALAGGGMIPVNRFDGGGILPRGFSIAANNTGADELLARVPAAVGANAATAGGRHGDGGTDLVVQVVIDHRGRVVLGEAVLDHIERKIARK